MQGEWGQGVGVGPGYVQRLSSVIVGVSEASVKRSNTFTKCSHVRPLDAMSGIRIFKTGAAEKATSGKYVPKNKTQMKEQKQCVNARESNEIEFCHVMRKGNRGIKSPPP